MLDHLVYCAGSIRGAVRVGKNVRQLATSRRESSSHCHFGKLMEVCIETPALSVQIWQLVLPGQAPAVFHLIIIGDKRVKFPVEPLLGC